MDHEEEARAKLRYAAQQQAKFADAPSVTATALIGIGHALLHVANRVDALVGVIEESPARGDGMSISRRNWLNGND